MKKPAALINQLYSIRSRYGSAIAPQKIHLLQDISSSINKVKSKKVLFLYNDVLMFLIAYPDNKTIYTLAKKLLLQLEDHVGSHETLNYNLYNSGITRTSLCAAFSFEITKWLRQNRPQDIKLISFEATDEQIRSILTVVMEKVETEKMQEGKAAWKNWLIQSLLEGEDLLDGFIAVFENSRIRPEVKDEFWNTIGINTEITFSKNDSLTEKLVIPYYHRSLIRKPKKQDGKIQIKKIKLNEEEAATVIESSRMILIRQLREIDPISFTYPKGVTYYQLPRGFSIALMNMIPERQVPNDSYLGYTVFKNGFPVAYAGSWIMFDSSRIGLNVFPYYRGGESQYIFQLVLQVHAKVYSLKRFTVDTYQIGNENYDGIRSGAFWVYQHAGFHPIEKEQQELAATEISKMKKTPGHRSSAAVLTKLAESRMELILHTNALRFDAVDLSDMYAAILKKQYNNNRILAEKNTANKLADALQINNAGLQMNYILKNWSLILLYKEKELRNKNGLKKELKNLFLLKSQGNEDAYIRGMQKAKEFRKYLVTVWKELTTSLKSNHLK